MLLLLWLLMNITIGSHRYDINDLEDDFIHLTNTCRGAEDIEFDENKFVRVCNIIFMLLLLC